MTALPSPMIDFKYGWNPGQGPHAFLVESLSNRFQTKAEVTDVTVTVFEGEIVAWNVRGWKLTKAGTRDKRDAYAKACWEDTLDADVREAILADIKAKLAEGVLVA